METIEIEKCHYCDKEAEYDDLASEKDRFVMAGVCKAHAIKYCEGS